MFFRNLTAAEQRIVRQGIEGKKGILYSSGDKENEALFLKDLRLCFEIWDDWKETVGETYGFDDSEFVGIGAPPTISPFKDEK